MNDHYGSDDDMGHITDKQYRNIYDQKDDVHRWFHFTDVAVFHIKVLMCVKSYLRLYIYIYMLADLDLGYIQKKKTFTVI